MSLPGWLESVRRRVRLRLALRWATRAAALWAVVACALLAAARVTPLGWERRAAVIGLPIALLLGGLRGATMKIPLLLVARAADRDLQGLDRIATATESRPRETQLAVDQALDAERWASTSSVAKAAPLRVERASLVAAATFLALAAVLSFVPNPMDEVIERRRAERALIEAAAEDIEEEAEAIEKSDLEESEARKLAERLRELAERLRASDSLELALDEVERAKEQMLGAQSQEHLATKTLLSSFERSLQTQPFAPDASSSLAEQLQALAEGGLDPSQLESAGQRLDALARSLESSDPALAAALSDAAASLSAGEIDPSALAGAGEALAQTQAGIAGQEALAAAASGLASLEQGLAASAAALAQGQGLGAAQAAGQGPGAGQGQGQGPGSGQGAPGQGVGAGGTSGTNAPFGSPATGGASQPNGSGFNPSDASNAPVYDPLFGDEVAEELRVSGQRTGNRDEIKGFEVGRGLENEILVPYQSVFTQWSARAAQAVEVLSIPASLRSLVRDYFATLAPEEDD